jgi:hypothetical protein
VCVALTTTPSSEEVREKVELYVYSPLGLYGLFYGEIYFYVTFTFTFHIHLLILKNEDTTGSAFFSEKTAFPYTQARP